MQMWHFEKIVARNEKAVVLLRSEDRPLGNINMSRRISLIGSSVFRYTALSLMLSLREDLPCKRDRKTIFFRKYA